MTATPNANKTAIASAAEAGLGKKFHNPTDAERYAWLRDGGFFHDLMMGRVAASGATRAEFDAAVDQAMREKSDERARDADRYAWLRSGGLFHHVIGVAGASGATGKEFDSLVDRGMAEDDDE